jgi:hypothetical protein
MSAASRISSSRWASYAEQLLDDALALLIASFTEMVVTDDTGGVDESAGQY